MDSDQLPRRRASFTIRHERQASMQRSFDDLDVGTSSASRSHRIKISKSSFEQDLAVLQEEFADFKNPRRASTYHRSTSSVIYDSPAIVEGYASVPLLDVTELPRGGISIQTKAVGAVQFGIPPETIKDSMRLGLEVPRVFIVPVERFCREIGPALGINLAEFE